MIFRVKNISVSTEEYLRRKKVWVSYMRIVLGVFLDSHESRRGEDKVTDEMKQWEGQYVSKNALTFGNEVANLTRSGVTNPITYDDLRWCVERFLEEKRLTSDDSADQLHWVIGVLMNFDLDIAETEEGRNYNLYEKKVGQVFRAFRDYIKSNQDDLMELKNSTDTIIVYDDDEKGVGVDENSMGVEEKYDFASIIHITRDIYDHFFEGEELQKAKTKIAKLYSVYLSSDSNAIKGGNTNDLLLGRYNVPLSSLELKSMEDLIDREFMNSWEKNLRNDSLYLDMYELLQESEGEKQELLVEFFSLLVKAGIKLKVSACPYFNNLDIFKFTNMLELEDFIGAMESTKLTLHEYSEFPLLKSKGIKEVISEYGTKPNRGTFMDSIAKPGIAVIDPNSVEITLTPSVKAYLEQIVREGYSEDQPLFRKEIVDGINKETLEPGDIKNALRVLNLEKDDKPNLMAQIREFSGIYSLLMSNRDVALNRSDLPDVVHKRLISTLRGNFIWEKEVFRNTDRLANLWKIIEKTSKELLYMEDEIITEGPRLSDSSPKGESMFGVEVWRTGGYNIPKVNATTTSHYIELYGRIKLIPCSSMLDEAHFEFGGQSFIADSRGVRPMVQKALEEEIYQVTRELDLIVGRDEKYSTEPLMDWLMQSVTSVEEIKAPKNNKKREVMKEEKMEDDDFYNNINDIDLDLFF